MDFSIPMLQIRNRAALLYYEYQGPRSRSASQRRAANIVVQREKAYSGMISPGARKRLAKCITLLVQMARPKQIYNPVSDRTITHRLSFITLSIPARKKILTAREGYELLLKHFLQWMRRTEGAKTFVWKAEAQKRGQLHYHITTPTFIHYQRIRDKWNNLLRQNDLMIEYKAEYGNDDPNSTDIHEVRHVKDLTSYMIKEFCKTIQNETPTTGKLWDASQNLKESKYFTIELTKKHEEYLQNLTKQDKVQQYDGERFTIFKMSDDAIIDMMSNEEKEDFSRFLAKLRRHEINQLFQEATTRQPFTIPRAEPTTVQHPYEKLRALFPELDFKNIANNS